MIKPTIRHSQISNISEQCNQNLYRLLNALRKKCLPIQVKENALNSLCRHRLTPLVRMHMPEDDVAATGFKSVTNYKI